MSDKAAIVKSFNTALSDIFHELINRCQVKAPNVSAELRQLRSRLVLYKDVMGASGPLEKFLPILDRVKTPINNRDETFFTNYPLASLKQEFPDGSDHVVELLQLIRQTVVGFSAAFKNELWRKLDKLISAAVAYAEI